jgi:hypothetical protein
MPDWKRLVRQRMVCPELPAELNEEIVSELAAHLEETYDTARSQHCTEVQAFELALQEVGDWRVLASDICHALKENPMTNRVRSFWLPALASFALASLLLLGLTRISMQPRYLVRLTSGLGPWFYAVWLVAQILSGALGASLSRRAGGTPSTRILSGIFPAVVMFGLWGVVIPASAMIQHNVFVLHHPLYYAIGIVPWVVLPGIALLVGTLPFLRERAHEGGAIRSEV